MLLFATLRGRLLGGRDYFFSLLKAGGRIFAAISKSSASELNSLPSHKL